MGKLKFYKTETKEDSIEFAPCVQCGSENINFYNCGYSSFNIAGAKCQNCGNAITLNNVKWDMRDSEIVPYWNEKNDLKILKAALLTEIKRMQDLLLDYQKRLDEYE